MNTAFHTYRNCEVHSTTGVPVSMSRLPPVSFYSKHSTSMGSKGLVWTLLLLITVVAFVRMNAALMAWPSSPAARASSATFMGAGPSPTNTTLDVDAALALLRHSKKKYVIADVKNGLGNRLRALASAMSLASSLDRPVMLVWVPDLHANCSFTALYQNIPFPVVEIALNLARLSARDFQVYNYMRGEPGAFKDEPVEVDPDRHLYFRSAYVMNHQLGQWSSGGPRRQIQRLQPVPKVQRLLVADRTMIGLHVRNVFDAPRDQQTNESVEGGAALQGAEKEYGKAIADTLLEWRRASHWSNFVPRITAMLQEHHHSNASEQPLRFYLAADSDEAYLQLAQLFPDHLISTRRPCEIKRCDFRDCESLVYSLVDLMNLARTRLILGSGYSSYSEVASQLGGSRGKALPILMAGRDFGKIVDRWAGRKRPSTRSNPKDESERERDGEIAGFAPIAMSVQQFWPVPFW